MCPRELYPDNSQRFLSCCIKRMIINRELKNCLLLLLTSHRKWQVFKNLCSHRDIYFSMLTAELSPWSLRTTYVFLGHYHKWNLVNEYQVGCSKNTWGSFKILILVEFNPGNISWNWCWDPRFCNFKSLTHQFCYQILCEYQLVFL